MELSLILKRGYAICHTYFHAGIACEIQNSHSNWQSDERTLIDVAARFRGNFVLSPLSY